MGESYFLDVGIEIALWKSVTLLQKIAHIPVHFVKKKYGFFIAILSAFFSRIYIKFSGGILTKIWPFFAIF